MLLEKPIRITHDFSIETMKARRSWINVLQTLRDYGCKPRLLYPAKLAFTINGESKIFQDKKNLDNVLPQTQPYRKY